MRKMAIMATAAGALTAASTFAPRANADRVCRQMCEAGFCKTVCVDEKSASGEDRVDVTRWAFGA